MTSRVLAVLAVASLVCALPVAAQRAGTIEVGGFARYVDFDNTLPMGDDMDIGGRVAVYNGSISSRLEALVGGGYVRNWYGAPYSAADQGLTVLLGVRYHLRDQLWLRLGADLDAMFHTADNSLFNFYNGNWGIHFGPSVRLNR